MRWFRESGLNIDARWKKIDDRDAVSAIAIRVFDVVLTSVVNAAFDASGNALLHLLRWRPA